MARPGGSLSRGTSQRQATILLSQHICDSPLQQELDPENPECVLDGLILQQMKEYETLGKPVNFTDDVIGALIFDLFEAGAQGLLCLPYSSQFVRSSLLRYHRQRRGPHDPAILKCVRFNQIDKTTETLVTGGFRVWPEFGSTPKAISLGTVHHAFLAQPSGRGGLLRRRTLGLLVWDEPCGSTPAEVDHCYLYHSGLNTTSNGLRALLAILANHPEIQTRMQKEIDEKIGEAEPRLQDRENMHYVNAVSVNVRPRV